MNNIEWESNAVCFAIGWQWFYDKAKLNINNLNGSTKSFDALLECKDFQLNEPRIGDYIEKSELDTEQEYNDAVEVFGLFGFFRTGDFALSYDDFMQHQNEDSLICSGSLLIGIKSTHSQCKRKLTYSQLMSIGKLKRMMNEREASKSDIQKVIDESRAELSGDGEKGCFIIGESDEGLENAIPDSARKNPDGSIEITFKPSVNLGQDFKKRIKDIENDIYNAVNKSAVKSTPKTGPDNVTNPSHYQLINGVESIEVIARSMTQEQWKGFCLGNILKYRIRAGKKDALQQDIDKANFYGELYEMHKGKCYG